MEKCTYCNREFDVEAPNVFYINMGLKADNAICENCIHKHDVKNSELFDRVHSKLETEIYALQNLDVIFDETDDPGLWRDRVIARSLEHIEGIPLDEISPEQRVEFLNIAKAKLEEIELRRVTILDESNATNTYTCDSCNKRFKGKPNTSFEDDQILVECDNCHFHADDFYIKVYRQLKEHEELNELSAKNK